MASTCSFLQLRLPLNAKFSPLSSSSSSRSLNNNNNFSSRPTFSLTTSTSSSPISPISVKSNLFGDSNVNPSCRENANSGVCFGSGGYHAEVVVFEDDQEDEVVRRFKREVSKAGVISECRRRRHYENAQDKRKRKLRDAGLRNRRRKLGSMRFLEGEGEGEDEVVTKKNDDDNDNWEMPAGGLPF